MAAAGFQQLDVYREASALANELRSALIAWEPFDVWTIGIQMVRAADSVGANIAEAYGRRTHLDRLRLLWVARGSICELQHWIATARERGLRLPPQSDRTADQVGRMLNGLAKARHG